MLTREKVRPARPLHRHFREKTRPARHKPPVLSLFSCAGRTFSRARPRSGHAGRTFSRTRHGDVARKQPPLPLQSLVQASMKPPSPLRTPEQQPLKPTTPLRPKNAPKSPISNPQRRRRFQLAHLTGPQRRRRFHARDLRCVRAMTGPDDTHSHAIPPVQESTQAQKPQSINDPITGSEIQSGELHATLIADQVEGPGRASSRRASHTSATRRHWCGGRRRVRRARAGFEIDHSERSSRVAISRAAGASGARNSRGATNNKLNREFRLRRRRGRRAGGQATRRPEIWRGHKHQ